MDHEMLRYFKKLLPFEELLKLRWRAKISIELTLVGFSYQGDFRSAIYQCLQAPRYGIAEVGVPSGLWITCGQLWGVQDVFHRF